MGRRHLQVTPGELALLASATFVAGSCLALAVALPSAWARLGREDGLVETLSVFAFLALSVAAVTRILRSPRGARAPSIVMVLVGIFGAGEELSWGQRVFDIEPPEFFLTHNAQREFNLHNLVQPPWDAILGVAVILAFCFSPLWRERSWARRLVARGVPWPRAVHLAVLVGCLVAGLAVAILTGARELEELGELVFVLTVGAMWSSEDGVRRPSRARSGPLPETGPRR